MESTRCAGDNALLRAASAPSPAPWRRAARAVCMMLLYGLAIGCVWFLCLAYRAGAWK